MAWIHLVARKFALVLRDERDLQIASSGPYTNEQGVSGWRYQVSWRGRDFYVSQSRTEDPIPLGRVAYILSDSGNLDERKDAVYQNRDLFPDWGLRVEAWYCGRWFQVFTPDNVGQPDDEFRQLLWKIGNERQKEGTGSLSKTVANLLSQVQRSRLT